MILQEILRHHTPKEGGAVFALLRKSSQKKTPHAVSLWEEHQASSADRGPTKAKPVCCVLGSCWRTCPGASWLADEPTTVCARSWEIHDVGTPQLPREAQGFAVLEACDPWESR